MSARIMDIWWTPDAKTAWYEAAIFKQWFKAFLRPFFSLTRKEKKRNKRKKIYIYNSDFRNGRRWKWREFLLGAPNKEIKSTIIIQTISRTLAAAARKKWHFIAWANQKDKARRIVTGKLITTRNVIMTHYYNIDLPEQADEGISEIRLTFQF